jgi:hypothetical protein
MLTVCGRRARPLWWLAPIVLSGCAFVTPRFSQDVQASFARDEMRKLTTRSLELYYPAPLKGEALRITARVEHCFDRLREKSGAKTVRIAPSSS